jgi:hypothetical protein
MSWSEVELSAKRARWYRLVIFHPLRTLERFVRNIFGQWEPSFIHFGNETTNVIAVFERNV